MEVIFEKTLRGEDINIAFLSKAPYFFKKDFIYLFLERGREGEREGEKPQCVVASPKPPAGESGLQPRHVP